jgi:hypothetical protein
VLLRDMLRFFQLLRVFVFATFSVIPRV